MCTWARSSQCSGLHNSQNMLPGCCSVCVHACVFKREEKSSPAGQSIIDLFLDNLVNSVRFSEQKHTQSHAQWPCVTADHAVEVVIGTGRWGCSAWMCVFPTTPTPIQHWQPSCDDEMGHQTGECTPSARCLPKRDLILSFRTREWLQTRRIDCVFVDFTR